MSNNTENDRSITTEKMYPIDLAPQKITIVKNSPNTEVKMAHLMSGQNKSTSTNQIITHTNSAPVSLMRTATAAQINSPGVVSQGTQIVSQGTQLISPNTQILTPPQLISSSQILSPGTQIISQGSQLSAQVSSGNLVSSVMPTTITSTVNVAGPIVGGTSNIVVSTPVRTLPSGVRVLPPIQHHNTRPALTSVVSNTSGVLVTKAVTSHVPRGLAAGASLAVRPVTVSTQPTLSQGAKGEFLSSYRGRSAVVYGSRGMGRGASTRQPSPAPTLSNTPANTQSAPVAHSAIVTLATTTALSQSSVISSTVRGTTISPITNVITRPKTPTPPPATARPLPLLQRNYQPAKVVSVANVGVRGVGNSAPAQLYYEVQRGTQTQLPRPATPYSMHTTQANVATTVHTTPEVRQASTTVASSMIPRPSILRKRDVDGSPSKNQAANVSTITSVGNVSGNLSSLNANNASNLNNIGTISNIGSVVHVGNVNANTIGAVNINNSVGRVSNIGPVMNIESINMGSVVNSLSINNVGNVNISNVITNTNSVNSNMTGVANIGSVYVNSTGWEDVTTSQGPGTGSTTISAASSPVPEEPEPPRNTDISPRKKPRKQILSSEIRQCESPAEEKSPSPSPPVAAPINPIPKRPSLSSGFVCGWRSTALHFTRPADVRRKHARAADILAIATRKHVLLSAEGWKVHHLTAQMDDLVSLEADVGEELSEVLRALEAASTSTRTHAPIAALKPLSHSLLELIKGNIQRSKIVCEGIQEAREDILRVFKHRDFVSEILTRQADQRSIRKHRSQS
ncbi:histone deacetylase complex subunit SAP130 [Leptidea sinapis]|uniref:Histone deacetylase complex subunit SAP130 C-terminal domain-containing protein n=1 Tax=Leptidea sinapis TaxID=189913 RepID=A0A5E4PSE1_9NEOP|nr:histone deacetylase complex subunit SAP130 [Leptidea sinapis]VVC89056.1 unnamed protein product [Leptidea sinapis]